MNNASGTSSLNRTRSTEWLLSVCAVLWGWAILQPEVAFTLPAYHLMAELMTESRWGALAILIGSLRILGLGINGFWRRSPLLRAAGTLASGLFWMCIGVLIFAASSKSGSPLAAGSYFYPAFFAFEGWCLAAAGYDMQKNGSLSVRGR
nr:hypothetical protein NG677_04005 [Methylobacterium sp. OTU13CASTA1]